MAKQITTTLRPLNPFPHRLTVSEDEMIIQGEAFFDQLQQELQPDLSDIIDETNEVATEVNTNANNAEASAILANGLANFQGVWSGATTYAKGQSVESTVGSKIYYTSKLDGNLNHAVTDTNYWLLNPINDKLDKDTAVLTAKTSLVDADVVLMGDSASSNTTKKITWANLKATIGTALGTIISSLAAKATPVNADGFVIKDSAASNASKFLSLANLKATIFTSPALTENPTAPTQAALDNSTRVATTAYVDGKFVRATPVATTSGTAIDFTSIPFWAKRITVMFSGVSTNGTSIPIVQIGTSSGIETSNYLGAAWTDGSPTGTSHSTGFLLASNHVATSVFHGKMELCLISSNTWTETARNALSNNSVLLSSAGSKSLSSTLDRIRITTASGTDTFDGGVVSITYEG